MGYTMDTFRKAVKAAMDGSPSAGTSGYTKIMGTAVATAEQMRSYLKSKNPKAAQSVLDMIPFYLSEGQTEGVRGDIAFAAVLPGNREFYLFRFGSNPGPEQLLWYGCDKQWPER